MTATRRPGPAASSRLSSDEVWRAIEKTSFLIISYTTPSGDPRSVGVMHKAVDRKLYVVTAPDSWKARHIAASGRVAVTVPVRRGGLLSLLAPIPPATVSFHGAAAVHPSDAPAVRAVVEELGPLLPKERREAVAVLEIVPEGTFVTYGIGVPLLRMRDTQAARARVPVT